MDDTTTPHQQVRVNPYRLFGVDPDGPFMRADIRNTMRNLVLSTHPDRPGGSTKKFRVVMECYKYMLSKADELRRTSEPITEDSMQHLENERGDNATQNEIPSTNADRFYGSKKFNRKAFNEFFEQNRLDDAYQKGHGDWLKDDSDEYEARHHAKVGKGQFQEAFEEERRRLLKKQQIVKHTGLIGVSLGKSTLAATDVDEIGMMSGNRTGVVKCSNGVMGVDIREALEVGVIGVNDDGDQNYTRTVSMEEAQKMRENTRMKLTPDEMHEYKKQQAEKERREKERRHRIQERDAQIETHFQKVNRMITNQ